MVRDEAGELGRGQVINGHFVSLSGFGLLHLKQWERWGQGVGGMW